MFGGKPPSTPITGPLPRLKNIVFKHFRGIPGVLIAIILIVVLFDKHKPDNIALCMWLWMAIFFLLQPVNVPVTGLIPIFFMPFTGTLNSTTICSCFFNENHALFILAGMMVMLMSSTGLQERILLWFLSLGGNTSGIWMLIKASIAAFLMSMIENRQIVTKGLIDIMGPVYGNTEGEKSKIANYQTLKSIIFTSVQVSATIGSIVLQHCSSSVMCMRAIWYAFPAAGSSYPDVFNYAQYTAFAMPLALAMFTINLIYYLVLFKIVVKIPSDDPTNNEMEQRLQSLKQALPSKIGLHLQVIILLDILFHIAIFTRWSPLLPQEGWSSFFMKANDVPGIKDATVAAVFVILMHALPNNCSIGKYMKAKKKSDLQNLRQESSLMLWRYMDTNTNYGYILLIGSGIALNKAVASTMLDVPNTFLGKIIQGQNFPVALIIVTFLCGICTNAMTGVATCCVFMPLVLNMKEATKAAFLRDDVKDIWMQNTHRTSLIVGIATAFGFMSPFKFTAAYPCHYTGKIPKSKMAIFSVISVIICLGILWIGVMFYAPIIWGTKGVEIINLTTEPTP